MVWWHIENAPHYIYRGHLHDFLTYMLNYPTIWLYPHVMYDNRNIDGLIVRKSTVDYNINEQTHPKVNSMVQAIKCPFNRREFEFTHLTILTPCNAQLNLIIVGLQRCLADMLTSESEQHRVFELTCKLSKLQKIENWVRKYTDGRGPDHIIEVGFT